MTHETFDRLDAGPAASEPRRVFGYCRVSTDRQIEGTSIDEQKRRIRGAAAMIGIDDPMIWSDEGVSGSIALAARPQGQQLLAGLRAGDTVISSKLDRMFRDITDAVIQLRTFTEAGIDLVLLDLGTESITSVSSSGISRLLFHFMAVLADFERNRIRERTMEAKAALRAQGLHPDGAPKFGFRVIKDGSRSRLVPDDREEEIIKAARLAWDQGKTIKQILAELYAAGFRNRRGGLIRSSQIYRWAVWSADPDRVNISQRTKDALARRKATGARLGNPEIRKISPLGVAAVMQNAAKRIAEVMPHIDELIAAGVSGYREVARILNASDRPSARGGRWHASSVRNAMRAAGRSFPAKASRSDHVIPVPQMRILRPATQRERQAIRERHREAMAALAAPRLGSVQKLAPQILAYKSEGLSAAGIARILGVSEDPVQRILRAAGLAEPLRTTEARRREEIREKILLLKRKGQSAEQIARELNLPIGRVYTALNRASGLDPRFNLGTAHLTSDELAQIAALRALHVPIAEIARRFGRSERTIFRAIAKLERGK